MTYIVQTAELSKSLKKSQVVDKVNLNVRKGEIYGFIGPNGAGKTTTIRMILNIIRPSGGTVELFGETVTDTSMTQHLRKIGAIIETPGFYLNLTGKENLDIHRLMMDISDRSSIDRALKLVGLSDEKNKKTRHYSLGMKQRLGLARALLHDPELLILDEPTNGLDPQGVVEIRDLLMEISKQGTTIFVSSHILAEVEKMFSRIGILHKGSLLEEFSNEEFQQKSEQFLLYKVSEPNRAANLITERLGKADISVSDDSISFEISEGENSGRITKLLVDNEIEVSESKIMRSSLEDYFIQLTGGGRHE